MTCTNFRSSNYTCFLMKIRIPLMFDLQWVKTHWETLDVAIFLYPSLSVFFRAGISLSFPLCPFVSICFSLPCTNLCLYTRTTHTHTHLSFFPSMLSCHWLLQNLRLSSLDSSNLKTDSIKLLSVRTCSACIWIRYLTIMWCFINISEDDFCTGQQR